jgi:hypothetical protein
MTNEVKIRTVKAQAVKAGGYSLATALCAMGSNLFLQNEGSMEQKAVGAALFLIGYGLYYFGVNY